MPDKSEHAVPSADVEQDFGEYDLLDDCRMMLRFAFKESADPDQSLQNDIAVLDTLLYQVSLPSISEVPPSLLGIAIDTGKNNSGQALMERAKIVELVLKVHAGLSTLVAPATPETLRATQPPPGRQRLLGGMPLIVKGTICAALVCLLGFLVTVPKPSLQSAHARASSHMRSPTPSPSASPPTQ
jgi:hypothetical protein